MSELYNCSVCGMTAETSWGGDTEFCNRCTEDTEYEPDGIVNPDEGQEVEHLYFDGEIDKVLSEFTVSVLVTDSRYSYLEGQLVEINLDFLN